MFKWFLIIWSLWISFLFGRIFESGSFQQKQECYKQTKNMQCFLKEYECK